MKKTNKPSNPLKVFNDNRAMAYKKAGGAMKDFKKSLPKAQTGQQTPFQQYMKIPGAVASDTLGRNVDDRSYRPNAPKNSSLTSALMSAWEKTYGKDYKSDIGSKPANETLEQYRRRMGKTYKAGGSVKSRKK